MKRLRQYRQRFRTQIISLFIGVASFFAMAGVSHALWSSAMAGKSIPAVAVSIPNENSYIANFRQELDTPILYYGLDSLSLKNLKHADVLFLGSSRMLFAARETVMRPFFERHHLTYFVLGFSNYERSPIPLDIIERFDLHPKLVVINADGFFDTHASPWGQKIIHDGAWGGFKTAFEGNCSFWTQHYLHGVIPKWSDVEEAYYGMSSPVIFRSRDHGEWLIDKIPSENIVNFRNDLNDPLTPRALTSALDFKSRMEARGIRMVLTVIPPTPGSRDANAAARILNATLIAPESGSYSTIDGFHLGETSALKTMAYILANLEKTKEFGEIK